MCAVRRSRYRGSLFRNTHRRADFPVPRRRGADAAIQNVQRISGLEQPDAHRLGRATGPPGARPSGNSRAVNGGSTSAVQDTRRGSQPGHPLEPHRQRDLSRRRWPGPRLARDGHPPRRHSRCRQRHRRSLRTLHCRPLVPWSVTRCCRRQRGSRRDARPDTQSAATNRARVRRRVG